MKAIAARTGVSISAVSLALRNQPGLSPALAQRIRTVAGEMGYQPPALLHEAMSQLRSQAAARFHSHIAVCTTRLDAPGTVRHDQWKALEKRAAQLGYGLEVLRLHKFTPRALRAVLRQRNTRGLLLDLNGWLRPDLEFLCEEFSCVLLGQSRRLGLLNHVVETDRFQAGKQAVEEALSRGYHRIGLVDSRALDPECGCRDGVHSALSEGTSAAIMPSAFPSPSDKRVFIDWFKKEKPDCILTQHSEVRTWLEEIGYKAPKDIGLIHLNRSQHREHDWAGIDTLEEEVDAAGLKKLISMLRQGESGIPSIRERILIEGAWADGETVRSARNQLIYEPPPSILRSCEGPSAKLKCLNLRPYVNRSRSGPGGWFGAEPLLHCPAGEHSICGTRFQILDEKIDRTGVIIMGSKHCLGDPDPNPTQVDIPLGLRVKSVHFLHACGWAHGDVRHFASYHFIGPKGWTQTVPLIARRELSGPESDDNIQDYWPNLPPLAASQVRPVHLTAYGKSELYSAYLYILEWVNPNPQVVIQTLRMTSDLAAETTLGVLAITVQL